MKPDTPKTTRKNLLACLALAALAASLPAAEEKPVVSLRSLLDEQIDRDALARFPDTDFTVRQFSSANPKSVAPDQPGWFANGDSSHFLREDNSRGRREWVLLDHAGPGAIVRFWVTVASTDGKGILRVYLDGSETPVIEGGVLKVLSGGKLAPPPLSASVSPLREYLRRGHNLYLPVPYAKHCLVTYESPTVRPKTKLPAGQRAESFFYNIEVRQYPENTRVETFSNDVLRDAAGAIARNNAALKAGLSGVDVSALEKIPLDGLLPPGGSKSWKITGAKAVRLLSLKIAGAETAPQKLRSTVLEILFDGRASVWSPVGDFFGTGFKYSPAQTWFTAIRPGGLMQAAWVMPFRESCEIRLRNLGEETVDVSGQAAVSDWNWGGNDMLFGAGWHELNRVRTRLNNDHFDVNYATLEGEGVLVGTGVSLFNTANRWWGEGDEKIFIEGAPKPTHIGTGSEDYYGYAWSCGLFFEHPFIAQPDGAGAGTTGHVVNTRVRALDKLPFHRRLQFDMELWHWADTVMNYAPNAQWYMKPGGLSNRGPEPEAAAVKLPKNRRDLIPLKLSTPGRIESDTLEAAVKGAGTLDTQKGEKYSGGRQLIWRGGAPGSAALFTLGLAEGGVHRVRLGLTKSYDYAVIEVRVNNGAPLRVDAYAPEVSPGVAIDLGAMSLAAGENTLSLKIIGKNPAGRHPARHYVGVDWFEVEKADAPAPPPSAATVTRLEAESLNASATRGAATPQSLPFMHWSGNAQLMWRGALPEDVLTLPFDATEAGPRELRAALTSASDYADLEIALNGAVVGRLDGWSAEVVTREVNLGVVELAAGRNTLAFRITGRNPKNTQPGKYFAGIDYIEWEPAPPPPAP